LVSRGLEIFANTEFGQPDSSALFGSVAYNVFEAFGLRWSRLGPIRVNHSDMGRTEFGSLLNYRFDPMFDKRD
jgi:hypothetical protein